MRSDAEVEVDVDNSKKLLAAAKLLADATARMVEAAKNAAKQAAAAATQTIAASQNAAASNKNTAAHQQLVQSCKAMADHIPQLVQGVRGSQAQPEDLTTQLALIITSQNFLQPGSKMVTSAKSSVPTVMDQAAAMQLGQCAKNLATSLAELRTAAQKVHNHTHLSHTLERELAVRQWRESLLRGSGERACRAAVERELAARQWRESLPRGSGERACRAAVERELAARQWRESLPRGSGERACRATHSKPYSPFVYFPPGLAARETAQALKTLAQAARGVAASTTNPQAAASMLDSACDVMEGSAMLIHEAKQALVSPSDSESQQRLAQVAKAVSHSLNNCVNCLPGQKDVDMALRSIGEASKKLLGETLPPPTRSFQEAQSELNQTAADLNQSAGDVVHASRGSSTQLADASGKFREDFDDFLDAGIEMAGHTQVQSQWSVCVVLNLERVRMLQLPPFCSFPLFPLFFQVLGESMAGISQNCKTGDVPAFGGCVGLASKALCGLTEAAGQASYLVGVSDPNSQAGHQGLVDAIQFARANQAIQMACQNLVDPDSSPSQVLSSATIVAKHTSALCNACRLASSKTANPTAKRHFVQSAKEVANSTANLVKTIKALDGDFSQENRNTCLVATAPLIEAVENLTAFASNPEFASSPAQISNEGSAAQEPILQSARSMLDSSTHLLKTARSLVINPKDPPTWSVLAGHSRTVSDSIKGLITAIRDKAPGQRECDYSIDNINRCIRNIEQASLAAVSQNLASRDDISLEALQEQLTSTVQEIGYLIDPISTAARGEAAQLGHKVTQLAGYFEPLIRASVGVASKLQDHQQQMTFLDQTKTLAESALQMIYAAKEGGGNPKASHTHDAIAEAAQLMREAVDDIMVTLNEAASEGGMVGAMVDSIAEAMGRLDEGTSPEPEGSFVDYQTTMVKYSKAIAVTAQEMMTKSVTCPEELGGLASRVTTDYSQLALQGRLAAHTAEPQEVPKHYSQSHPSIHPFLLSQFDYYVTLICFLLNKPGTR
ncbi:unnamed protein product [Oncorhynchus mykiss]|uniref:I/LWEQ domain-containing protein n=1 Tax=Oncorhynchus mykiss TaxID=8022 RepID=A0A060YR56_ONCMY|nr:unnamed protein product [Oncorhynchus mykiss]